MHTLFADAVLLLHFGVVVFVIGGLVAIVAGNLLLHWPWVNRFWFRMAHVVAIGVVAVQAWLGQACPLTTLETWLRRQAGEPGYEKSFIEHWIEPILFFHAPAWVFTAAYTTFGLLVLLAWWYFPPRRADPKDSPPHRRHD